MFDLAEHSHRRLNALTGEWVQVSPHRSKRPWQGQVEKAAEHTSLSYDPTCYLCPGNKRTSGDTNPDYKSTYSFTNDFSAIVSDVPEGIQNEQDLLVSKSERGICKVICFSPHHSLTIPEMETSDIRSVVQQWIKEYEELSKLPFINYIQIFENKGAIMGCSNPHPHGQIWAQQSIPVEPLKKQQNQLNYFERKGRTLLNDYIALELKNKERIIVENDHFVAMVPFWATWPFEAMIVPRRAMARIIDMNEDEITSMADMYRRLTIRYDNLFQVSFPYSAGIHQAPSDGEEHPEWHWHMVFYPPLLRSATVKKFMVGYELLANPQRDITPEFAAEKLRAVSSVHYKHIMKTAL